MDPFCPLTLLKACQCVCSLSALREIHQRGIMGWISTDWLPRTPTRMSSHDSHLLWKERERGRGQGKTTGEQEKHLFSLVLKPRTNYLIWIEKNEGREDGKRRNVKPLIHTYYWSLYGADRETQQIHHPEVTFMTFIMFPVAIQLPINVIPRRNGSTTTAKISERRVLTFYTKVWVNA